MSQTQAGEGKKKRRSLETSDYLQYFKEKQVVETKMKEGHMDVETRKFEVEERRLEMDVQLRQREVALREGVTCAREELGGKRKGIKCSDREIGYVERRAKYVTTAVN